MNLTPKTIILTALRSKLKGSGITRITLVFCVESDKYNLMVSNQDGSKMTIDLDQGDINTIKQIFVRRIQSAWNKKHSHVVKDVIVQIDMITEDLQVFIQDDKDKVFKFEY